MSCQTFGMIPDLVDQMVTGICLSGSMSCHVYMSIYFPYLMASHPAAYFPWSRPDNLSPGQGVFYEGTPFLLHLLLRGGDLLKSFDWPRLKNIEVLIDNSGIPNEAFSSLITGTGSVSPRQINLIFFFNFCAFMCRRKYIDQRTIKGFSLFVVPVQW